MRLGPAASRVLAVLFAPVLAAALLGVGELAVRAVRGAPPSEEPVRGSQFDYFHLQIHEDFFKKVADPDETERFHSQRDRASPASFLAEKPKKSLRVFVVGGSVAILFNDQRISQTLQLFRRALPAYQVEIVGCGMGGYDSYRDGLVVKEVLRYRPDLVVVLTGNNEYADPVRIDPKAFRRNLRLRRSALLRSLQDFLARGKAKPTLTLEQRNRQYAENVRAMVADARGAGVPIVFCTLPVNRRDVPPVYSRPPEADARYDEAWTTLDRGDARGAARLFEEFTRSRPGEASGWFWLGKALDRSGEAAAARAAYDRALDLDDPGDRQSPRRNTILRGLADERGVVVADLDERFSRLVPDGIPDARVFKDQVHWGDEYYPLVSLTILQALDRYDRTHPSPILAPVGEWDMSWAAAAEKELARPTIPPATRERFAREAFFTGVSGVFQSTGVMESAIAYFQLADRHARAVADRLPTIETVQAEVDRNPWLEHVRGRLRPEWGHVLAHLGEAYRRLGRLDLALPMLEEAVRSAPDLEAAAVFRVRAYQSSKKADAAAAELKRLSESKDPETRAWAAALSR